MAKRKKQGSPAFNPVSFNVENVRRAMDNDDDDAPDAAPEAAGPELAPEADAPPPRDAEAEPPAVAAEPAPRREPPAARNGHPAPPPKPRVDRTPVKRRRPEPQKKGRTLAAAAAAKRERDLYKVDYLRVFVDARQRRDLGRFVMDLNDALDVRLPETIVYRALLSIMQSAQGHVLAAAEAGEPLPATPARQDRLQMAEAEYRVAQLLRDGILAAAEEDLDALYHGRLQEDDDGEDAEKDAQAAA